MHDARIFDLDGSVTRQERLEARLGSRLDIVDLTDLGRAVRYIPTKESASKLDAAVTSCEPRWLTMAGSGDFHHVSASILKGIEEPFSLVVFDQHSDWIGSSPCPCGAWLTESLKLEKMVKLVSIGVEKSSIQGWCISHGPLADISAGRVELYPYEHPSSKCLGRRVSRSAAVTIKPRLISSDIYWTTIAGRDWETLISDIVSGLPTSRVYVSIDKDCLRPEHAFSNWGNGHLTLDQLTRAITMLMERKDVIGADICGEYSEIILENRMLEKMAVKTHPQTPAPNEGDFARNEETNLALVDALGF